ncbi:hypothetical protein SprV_0501926300 [Sparganum proliferum]
MLGCHKCLACLLSAIHLSLHVRPYNAHSAHESVSLGNFGPNASSNRQHLPLLLLSPLPQAPRRPPTPPPQITPSLPRRNHAPTPSALPPPLHGPQQSTSPPLLHAHPPPSTITITTPTSIDVDLVQFTSV